MREGVVLVDAASNDRAPHQSRRSSGCSAIAAASCIGQSVEPLISMPATTAQEFERVLREHDRRSGAAAGRDRVRAQGRLAVRRLLRDLAAQHGRHGSLARRGERRHGDASAWSASIIDIANREQQRIGSDLHDGLGQELTGIALMLRGVVAQLSKEDSAARLRRRRRHRAREQRHREHAHARARPVAGQRGARWAHRRAAGARRSRERALWRARATIADDGQTRPAAAQRNRTRRISIESRRKRSRTSCATASRPK